jgi:nucleoside-diphosphate-sugar epimerase
VRIAVTGSAGRLGQAVMAELDAVGHRVFGMDVRPSPAMPSTTVQLTDYGQTLDALLGVTARHDGLDALVHLAAVPVNGLVPDVTTFHNNLTATFNVLFAAHRAGIDTLIHASSITAMGFPFETPPPYLPVDENVSSAFTTYGLAKVLEERMAAELAGWSPNRSITSLRFTNVVGPGEYESFAPAGDLAYRRDLLGSYVDVRDASRAVALALDGVRPGHRTYCVAAPDSGLDIPSIELAAQWFPGVEVSADLAGYDSLVSSRKAQEQLGFRAEHTWRAELGER